MRLALLACTCALAGCLEATTLDEYPCPPGGTDLTYATFGRDHLDVWCQPCHAAAAPSRRGAPVGFTFDTREEIATHAERIFARAAADNTTMPPGPDDPPADERERLAEWLACGAP